MAKVRYIVKRSSLDEFTFAVITAKMPTGVAPSDNDFCERVTRALSRWVADTEEGMSWYEGTSRDANIGDLCALGELPRELKRELRDEHIRELEIEVFSYDDCCANWTYDTYLVDEGYLGD